MTTADDQIRVCIDEAKSFLVDAGAGSGKTSSLIAALTYIRGERRATLVQNSQQVACITFTNVAKDEIIERTEHDPLFVVSTIHDFLWSAIKGFQKELRLALHSHNAALPPNSKRKVQQEELLEALKKQRVTYSDRGANFLEGRIFHDDLIDIASIMFDQHTLLSKIVAARFPFIFVDEYQDTNAKIVAILLKNVSSGVAVIGFFGDKMQSIYSDGIGEISHDLAGDLTRIKKQENYRCSKAVIKLLNNIRKDIQQTPSGNNKDGSAVYINLNNVANGDILTRAREVARERFDWKDNDKEEIKYLFLTHRLIAGRAGYPNLFKAYNERGGFYQERFQSGEDEASAFFLEKIEPLISAWKGGKTGNAISILGGKGRVFASPVAKEAFRNALNVLLHLSESGTVKAVLLHIKESGLIPLTDTIEEYLTAESPPDDADQNKEWIFYTALFGIAYKEISAYRQVFDSNLPYSTKHGVKGAEFDTVYVILDDAGARWNQYSFGKLLSGAEENEDRRTRTGNLFYVCCSRPKNRLAVVDLGNAQNGRNAIKTLFGENNCVF